MIDNTEYELRILEVDIAEVQARLEDLGAKKIGEYDFRRHVFEVIPAVKGRWVRLRTNGENTTLTIKQIQSDEVDGTAEWETNVDDFDVAFEMLEKMGLKSKGYQENKRIEYKLDGAQICIDTWPKIPTYLEIEASSKKKVLTCAKRLGYTEDETTGKNTEKIYMDYGIDISKDANLAF